MVGCVLVNQNGEGIGERIGQGWHRKFGGAHAEVEAIRSATQPVDGCTAYVTLEPCSHFGKTPPCVQALIGAKVARVVVGHLDPNPEVNGRGIRTLQEAGIEVDVGILENKVADVLAPYVKKYTQKMPWIIAKWAMTLDGKIATYTGHSQWISNEQSRERVHRLRGRMDAIMVGSGTAQWDDPLLTARPPGQRTATRIVVDSRGQLALDSQLVKTANEFPTLIATGPALDPQRADAFAAAGCEVWQSQSNDPNERLMALLQDLANRGMTNILVEGGGKLLGSLHDVGMIDEVHVFIGPKLAGGEKAVAPVGGAGALSILEASEFSIRSVEQLAEDVYIQGRRAISGRHTNLE